MPAQDPGGDLDRDHRGQAQRQEGGARLGRPQLQDALEIQRQEVEHRELTGRQQGHVQVGTGDVALGQQPEPDQRVGHRAVLLPQHEGDQQDDGRRQRDDGGGRRPRQFLGAHHAEDQQAHTAGGEDRAEHVEFAPAVAEGAGRDAAQRQQDDRERHRQVHQHHPAPAGVLGEQTADQHTGAAADRRDGRVHAERLGALLALALGEGEDGQRGRRHHRGAHALDRAGDDHVPRLLGQSARERGDGEGPGSPQQHAPLTEQVRRPAPQKQEAAEEEGVDVDHPGELGGIEPQTGPHVG